MNEQPNHTCQQCKYFHQHYVRLGRTGYTKADAGHCSNPRIRDKKPDTPCCQRFRGQ